MALNAERGVFGLGEGNIIKSNKNRSDKTQGKMKEALVHRLIRKKF